MTYFGGYNNMRAVTDPSYVWETAAMQAVVDKLDRINRQLQETQLFLSQDLSRILIALYHLIDARFPEVD